MKISAAALSNFAYARLQGLMDDELASSKPSGTTAIEEAQLALLFIAASWGGYKNLILDIDSPEPAGGTTTGKVRL